MDVSIIINCTKISDSIRKTIAYAEKRKLTLEILSDISKANGKFIILMDPFLTYYNDYFIHYQWVRLNFSNVYNVFAFENWTVYDRKNNEFYSGAGSSIMCMYKRKKGRSRVLIEKKVLPGCKLDLLIDLNSELPDDVVLTKYLDALNLQLKDSCSNTDDQEHMPYI